MTMTSSPPPPHDIPAMQTVVRMMRRPVGVVIPGVDLVVQQEENVDPLCCAANEVLLRRLYLSLDPAMRGWMNDIPSYIPPVQVGAIMRGGGTICQVLRSDHKDFRVGDIVKDNSLDGGWDEYAIVQGELCHKLTPLPPGVPMTAHLSVLGVTGMTAYFGLLEVGKPKAGETILVSAAAGATGSVVCQIAKHVIGCKVIGIAGGPNKCQWLLREVGCDAVIDYKLAMKDSQVFQKQLRTALKEVDSKGFDIFFDNVGGFILNETLRRLNRHGRVVLCGAISAYNVEDVRSTDVVPPTNYMSLISLRAKIEGFIVTDYARQFKEAKRNMVTWIAEGKLTFKEDIRIGLESAPEYLNELFNGGNKGKLIVKVGDPIAGTIFTQQSRL
jgi:NADPH-dependent curcumin reductase